MVLWNQNQFPFKFQTVQLRNLEAGNLAHRKRQIYFPQTPKPTTSWDLYSWIRVGERSYRFRILPTTTTRGIRNWNFFPPLGKETFHPNITFHPGDNSSKKSFHPAAAPTNVFLRFTDFIGGGKLSIIGDFSSGLSATDCFAEFHRNGLLRGFHRRRLLRKFSSPIGLRLCRQQR